MMLNRNAMVVMLATLPAVQTCAVFASVSDESVIVSVSDENVIVSGDGEWVRDYQFGPIVKQGTPGASGRAVSGDVKGLTGSWRCMVEVGPKTKAAGIVVLTDETGRGGLECLMGGTGAMRGFMLRAADGKVLWSDKWAPWMEYEPCVVEVVVEKGRVRAQLLQFDGKTLISQSEWIKVDSKLTSGPGLMGLATEGGIARFWGWRIATSPLAGVTPDAPNKRRIVPGKESAWNLVGPMTWQWKTSAKKRIRQTSNVDRGWAFNNRIRGKHRLWSCRVKVFKPSGGAGLAFQADGTSKNGLLCWLGGTYGNGCLMLYDLSKDYRGAMWSGPLGKWKYDTEYVLIGETRRGQVRVKMLAADGKTVISESPWIKHAKDREGMIGFHTWRGPSEFWAFSAGTQSAAGPTRSAKAVASAKGVQWKDNRKRLVHTGDASRSYTWVSPAIKGTHGLWRVNVKPGRNGTSELLFQVADDKLAVGFVAGLVVEGNRATLKLINLPKKVLWYSSPIAIKAGTTYVLEGMTTTDRVRARLYAADGKKMLADSDQHYVSDAHNQRVGNFGLRATGPTEFWNWSLSPEK